MSVHRAANANNRRAGTHCYRVLVSMFISQRQSDTADNNAQSEDRRVLARVRTITLYSGFVLVTAEQTMKRNCSSKQNGFTTKNTAYCLQACTHGSVRYMVSDLLRYTRIRRDLLFNY